MSATGETTEATDSAYQEGFTNLEMLFNAVSGKKDLNEAQTRFEIIDSLLYGCLGWQKHKNINVEELTNVGYADYIIRTSQDVAVLEAKRQSTYFKIPVTKKIVVSSLQSLIKGNADLEAAVAQVKAYAQDRGIPLAIISNGTQYVAFIASRSDGQSPEKGQAIAFSSLEQIKENYIDFWNYFSKEGVIEGNLHRLLLKGAVPVLPVKPASLLPDYPGVSSRNEIQNDLVYLSELVLEDLPNGETLEKEFLKHCYCESGALTQFAILARDIIKNRYEQVNDTTQAKLVRIAGKDGVSQEFLNITTQRPIILIGDVGVGKTTFIRNLILSDDGILGRNDIALHINLGESAILSVDIKSGALQKIKQILNTDYDIDINEKEFVRGVYGDELQQLKKSIYQDLSTDDFKKKEIETLEKLMSNDAEHAKRSIDYIQTRKIHKTPTKVVVFLDNADQRNSNDQQDIFLIAQELATETLATVFVSIRPETFYLSHRAGVLKAYHPKVFTIEPPRIDLMLQKRIEFGLKISRGEIAAPSLGGNTVKLNNLTTMLEVMLRTLKSDHEQQKSLMTTIDSISAGSARRAVDIVKNFLSSAHTNTRKILETEEEKHGSYYVPMHEFMRSLIYGDNTFYNPNVSLISNMYSISSSDPKEYFLKLIIINELIFLAKSDEARNGFIDTKLIYNYAQSLGFVPNQIEKVLEFCLREELIENPINTELHDSELAENSVRITPRGAVYVGLLAGTFQYVDAMLVDIPIIDKTLLGQVSQSLANNEVTVDERLVRAEAFIAYLKKIYKEQLAPLGDERIDHLVGQLWSQFSRSVARARESVQRTANFRKAREKK